MTTTAVETERPRKTAAARSTTKKTASKKSAAPKATSKKATSKKATATKSAPRKSAPKKAAARKSTAPKGPVPKPEQQAEQRMHAEDESQESAELSASTALASPLDLLLADGANGPLRRFIPGMSGVKFTAGLVRHPRVVAKRTAGLAYELTRVGLGRSRIAPGEKDRRFGEEAWAKNPLFKRTLQSYLAVGEAARGLVDDAGLDWGDDQRMRFIVDNLVEAAAPSNNPFLNPKVLKRTLDTGGGNLVAGGRRFVKDFATAPRVPSMVEADAFEVGGTSRSRPVPWSCAPTSSS